MEITGKIIAVLPERSGTSARTGTEWKVATYVLETREQFPKHLCFEVFGVDRIAQMNIQGGEELTVSFDVDAHEYNGRWYNSIRAFRVDRNVLPVGAAPGVAPNVAPAPAVAPFPPASSAGTTADVAASQPSATSAAADILASGGDSDLPF